MRCSTALIAALSLSSGAFALSACAQPQQGGPPPGYGYGAPPPAYAGEASGQPPQDMQSPPPPGAYGQPPAGYGGQPPAGYGGQAPGPGAYGEAPPPDAYGQAPAPGAPAQHMGMKQRFAMANTTHDGRLTLEQAEAAGMRNVARHFAAIDRDRKGYVTLQDIHAWHREVHAEHAAQGQAPGAPPPGADAPPPPGGPGPEGPGGQQY